MSSGQHDPIKDAITELWRDIKGESGTKSASGTNNPSGPARPRSLSPFLAIATVAAFSVPAALRRFVVENPEVLAAASKFHDYRWLLTAVLSIGVMLDISRSLSHRYRTVATAITRQLLRVEPVRVWSAFPAGLFAARWVKVQLPPATIIRPKELDELTSMIRKSRLVKRQGITATLRVTILGWLASRHPWFATHAKGWTLTVRHDVERDRIIVTRQLLGRQKRTTASHLEQVLRTTPLKETTVTVCDRDGDGVETAYRIGFQTTADAGLKAFQNRIEEALVGSAGKHASGRHWVTEWHPFDNHLIMRLQAPLPNRVNHPLELVDEDLRHLPYSTGEDDKTMVWDVSTKSNKPHCLIVGPTGGGKTSVIRTLLTEAARRHIPFLGVDPKMIELDGLEGYPGCGAIVYDPIRAAMLVRALHSEMMARNNYVHVNKIEPSELPLLIAVLDEFFILSGKWQRLLKTGDEETRQLLAMLDPLGAWADLAVLARSAGIRLLLGVQRPDAQLFGNSSGNARDNFGTRISLGNLSQDGAQMMWGDTTVGRTVDTSIPGRGMVTAADGTPVPAQMWWTPNVDRHPNKWNQLSADEKAMIEGLAPTEAPQFVCYSRELRDFIESERALAKNKRSRNAAPEPFILATHDESIEDDAADAIPASAVTEGMTILLAVDGVEDLVPVVADKVTVSYDELGLVAETAIVTVSGRVQTSHIFTAGEVVFLPEADLLVAA